MSTLIIPALYSLVAMTCCAATTLGAAIYVIMRHNEYRRASTRNHLKEFALTAESE